MAAGEQFRELSNQINGPSANTKQKSPSNSLTSRSLPSASSSPPLSSSSLLLSEAHSPLPLLLQLPCRLRGGLRCFCCCCCCCCCRHGSANSEAVSVGAHGTENAIYKVPAAGGTLRPATRTGTACTGA